MKYIYLKFDLNITHLLEVGKVVLVGRTGIKYINKALLVPGYGWVPCSKALSENFTNDPKHLVLIVSEEDDPDKPVTSDIWIARTGLLYRLGREYLSGEKKTIHTSNKEVAPSTPNIKVLNRMSARALVISENEVLRFVESVKRNDNGVIIRDENGHPIKRITFECGTKKGIVSSAAISIIDTGTIDDFQYAEVSVGDKMPIPCILKVNKNKNM